MSRSLFSWRRFAVPWRRIEWPAASAPLVGLAATPVVLALVDRHTEPDALALTWISGIAVTAALVTAAVLVCLDRAVITPDLWPLVVLLAALAAHSTTSTTLGLVSEPGSAPPPTWSMAVELAVLGGAMALVHAFRRRGVRPPPMVLGAGFGLLVSTVLVATPGQLPAATGPVRATVAVALLLTYCAAAALVRRDWPWSARSRGYATFALMTLGAAQAAQGLVHEVPWLAPAAAGAELVAAGLLGSTMYAIVNRDLLSYRHRAWVLREQLLEEEEASRRERASRHAMRNMVAGISMASELLEDDHLEEPMRRRLEHTIHEEADQLRRLLDQNGQPGPRPGAGHEDASPAVTNHPARQTSDSRTLPVLRFAGETDVDDQIRRA